MTWAVMVPAAAHTWTVTTTQDDPNNVVTCNNDSTCTSLRDAIFTATNGDTIVFDLPPDTLPATISLFYFAPLEITDKSLTIHGPGANKLSISARSSEVFRLGDVTGQVPVLVTIDHLRIANGAAIGSLGGNGSPGNGPGDAGEPGQNGGNAFGGCIYVGVGDTLKLQYAVVENCVAVGGAGGAGGAGAAGAAGTDGVISPIAGFPGGSGGAGGAGGTGGYGLGGAIAVHGQLDLLSTTLHNNYASGGAGGNGGAGGTGGAGGDGGSACVISCNPNGGDGGDGGQGGDGGSGGAQGWGVGGAIYAPNGFTATNSTLVENTATDGYDFGNVTKTGGNGGAHGAGGAGGAGGNGATSSQNGQPGLAGAAGVGGTGGSGGTAEGGGVFNYDTAPGNVIKHTTIAYNRVRAGLPGLGADGSAAGSDGWTSGGGVESQSGAQITFWNSIIAANIQINTVGGRSASNCNLLTPATQQNDNLSNDASCGTDMVSSVLAFAPPKNGSYAYAWGGNGLPVVMPLPGSPAIGGAEVHTKLVGSIPTPDPASGCAAPVDERDVARPQPQTTPIYIPATCDLGAVQSDVIFINGFDN